MIIKQCLKCKKSFNTYPSKHKKYCSPRCFLGEEVFSFCLICKKKFHIPPSSIKVGGNCCSRKCMGISRKDFIPWNAGTKGLCKPNSGSFKKGDPRLMGNQIRKGMKLSESHKQAQRNSMLGRKNWNWIEDKTKLKGHNSKERRSSAYVIWRREVCKRDGWKCKINNNECSGRLEAHHIESFTKYPELRHQISNGITLCKFHHPRKRKEELKLMPLLKLLIN